VSPVGAAETDRTAAAARTKNLVKEAIAKKRLMESSESLWLDGIGDLRDEFEYLRKEEVRQPSLCLSRQQSRTSERCSIPWRVILESYFDSIHDLYTKLVIIGSPWCFQIRLPL
jgi:hypothetical protein